jgi:hypothetical protein
MEIVSFIEQYIRQGGSLNDSLQKVYFHTINHQATTTHETVAPPTARQHFTTGRSRPILHRSRTAVEPRQARTHVLGRPRMFGPAEEKEIAFLRRGGAKLKQLAKRFGVGTTTIRNILGRHGYFKQ